MLSRRRGFHFYLILASLTFGTGVIFHEDKRPILLNKEIRKQKESQIHKDNLRMNFISLSIQALTIN